MSYIRAVNGLPITFQSYDASTFYSTGLAASSTITLPSSGTFTSSTAADIMIILNDHVLEVTRDFTVVGSGPNYTQISNVLAFPNNSVLRCKQTR